MNRKIMGAVLTAALVTMGGVTVAQTAAAETLPICVPSEDTTTVERTDWLKDAPEGEGWEQVDEREVVLKDAWTEVIPAEGDATITVPNPEHIPAVPETPEVSHMDREYKEVLYTEEWQYHKQVRGVIYKKKNFKDEWKADTEFGWEDFAGSKRWSSTDADVLESGPHSVYVTSWNADGFHYLKQTTEYRYVKTGKDRTMATGFGEPKWFHEGEYPTHPWVYNLKEKKHVTQEYVPGSPAQGDEMIEVDNPDYVPGKTIEHPAEMGKEFIFERTVTVPGVDCPPVVTPDPDPTDEPTEPTPTDPPVTPVPTPDPTEPPAPTEPPSDGPTDTPTDVPTTDPTDEPTTEPTDPPTPVMPDTDDDTDPPVEVVDEPDSEDPPTKEPRVVIQTGMPEEAGTNYAPFVLAGMAMLALIGTGSMIRNRV